MRRRLKKTKSEDSEENREDEDEGIEEKKVLRIQEQMIEKKGEGRLKTSFRCIDGHTLRQQFMCLL